jgi:putative transposase
LKTIGSKKNLRCSVERRRELVDFDHDAIGVKRQCELLGLNRSTVYYKPKGDSSNDTDVMTLIDSIYTEMPFYGSRKMAKELTRLLGEPINRKRVRRLMERMGIQAIYSRPRTTIPHPAHKKYPYLLRDVPITHVGQVWSTDITYIRLERGFAYLVAVIDWHSRYVISWRLSNTMDAGFCIDALKEALATGTPEVFNTDQGSQFTCEDFLAPLLDRHVSISMDGRGRALDNIFVERLWRSVKYENVYLKGYQTIEEARRGLAEYFKLYNQRRLHESLDYKTPEEVHYAIAA